MGRRSDLAGRIPPGERSDPEHPHGLGLVLARTLIESEGGQLLLAGTSPTRFEIRLPPPDRARA